MEGGKIIETSEDPLFGEVLFRLRRGKKDLATTRKPHVCSQKTCQPTSELTMIQEGTLEGPPLSSNVYLCIYGIVHICSASSCDVYATTHNQTCHISGIQHASMISSYDKNDHRTWYGKRDAETTRDSDRQKIRKIDLNDGEETPSTPSLPKGVIAKKRNKKSTISQHDAIEKARQVVDTLLFSASRTRCNEAAILEYKNEANVAKQAYVKSRSDIGQLPYGPDIYRLVGYYQSKPLPFIEFEKDEALIEYYAHVIYQVWELVLKYIVPTAKKKFDSQTGDEIVPTINYEFVCIGVLYEMRHGKIHDNMVILPHDDFLEEHLPTANRLCFFGYPKNAITKGNSILKSTYENAIDDGVSVAMLTLDVKKLPQQNFHIQYFKLGEKKL